MSISNTLKTMMFASVAVVGFAGAVATNGYGDFLSTDAGNGAVKKAKEQPKSYIVQGKGSETLKTAVTSVGGSISREFPIINAVSAVLTPSQAEVIAQLDDVRIQDDRSVATMSAGNGQNKKFIIDNYISTQTGADQLHELGITGLGVTVAVLDSGTIMAGQHGFNLLVDSEGYWRVPAKYDAIKSRRTWWLNDDKNGHGSHVSGIIASSLKADNGKFNGIAPDVYLLSVKAFDKNGQSSYSKVLDGLNWIYHNRETYRIRVLNLSLGADVQSNYWDDPINQAIMKLWEAGIVVVTSAGNSGHEDMSITVPGNNPYIITVGAITDSYTPFDYSDDRVTTFSSTGPTVEGFVKPEVVAYGGHIAAKVDNRYAFGQFFESETGLGYQEVSGTSQASAVVSGIAALMLQYNPYLSPDDVKCRIMASAKMAHDESGKMKFSPFEQGHGMVNAYAAVASNKTGCANRGLDIQADLAGTAHFMGPVTKTTGGEFAILVGDKLVTEGHQWGDSSMLAEGHQWGDSGIFAEGHQWGDSGIFSEGHQWGDLGILAEGHQWGDSGIFAEGHQWGDSGIFAEGHQWGDSGMFAEAWNNRDLFSEVADSVVTPSDLAIQDEDGEEPVQEWETTERSAPVAPPLN
ncbi:S8 family peptidase [Alteromonas sp. W364]|uniref:S8 family peptidase n=1 Tax=Alteromonas sp. W364 TaxID=3075610 RepID=UPI002883D3DB|nr:S8 family peptidase [Alteromonas sp. W364]MDT0627769.1 S8 family peptidase [Alteromonas sp. W364]